MTSLFFFVSLLLLRMQELQFLRLGKTDALRSGIITGVILDLSLALLPAGLAWALSSLSPRLKKPVQILSSAALWIIVVANVCYFSFFRSQLYLWVATSYSENAWSVRKIAIQLLQQPMILASFALFVVSIAVLFTRKIDPAKLSRTWRLSVGAILIASSLLLKQSPIWIKLPAISESLLANNIAWTWYKEATDGAWKTRLPLARYEKMLPNAREILDRYIHLHEGPYKRKLALAPEDPDRTKILLGFQRKTKLNVIILFLESGRSYELLNPRTSDEVYPHFKKILSEHGIFFSQAYSTANFTVQGQFSTLCSDMDRADSAPVYTRQPYLKIDCLQSLFAKEGYGTYWMNPYHRFFSGKFVFESNHGMQFFYDRDTFRAENPEEAENSNEWGVNDNVFLSKAMDQLEKIALSGKPFFAHLLTTGTHAPWHEKKGYELSESLSRWAGDKNYAGYLSSVKAMDHALGRFFDRFFKSPISDNTVVVVLGDHGTGVVPPSEKLTSLQRRLLWPRIIMSVITKKMPHPQVVKYAVHQMDVAPLIVSAVGMKKPDRWLGRDPLLFEGGTFWVKKQGITLLYRTSDRICSKRRGQEDASCWKMSPTEDPLFISSPPQIPENRTETDLVRSVIQANEAILEFGG